MTQSRVLFFSLLGLILSNKVSCEDSSPGFCHGLDCPKYSILERTDDYEVRSYESSKWVSTVISGYHFVQSQSKGFNLLFKYISGANEEQKRIEMTAPVKTLITPTEGPLCETKFTVSFFVPFDVQDSIPKPTNKNLFIEETSAMTVYVKSFGGYMTEQGIVKKASELVDILQNKGIEIETENYYACGYDSPFRIVARHNEIWIIGKSKSAGGGSAS